MSKRIIALHTGCPRSASDWTVFKRMQDFQQLELFFAPGEFLLADAVYDVSSYFISPYKFPASKDPENAALNYYLDQSRVHSEHCIGILKGRWQSLRDLRHHIRDDNCMGNFCYWVIACCVLQNIVANFNDEWTETVQDGNINEFFSTDDYLVTVCSTRSTFRKSLKRQPLRRTERKGSSTSIG